MRRVQKISALKGLQQFFQFHPQLVNDLLALGDILFGSIAGELLARTADGEALLIEQTADLADDQHIMTLVVAAIAAAFDRLELGELLLPIAQHMRLNAAKIADFADGEVALTRDRRELAIIPGFQHKPLPAL